MFKETWKVFRKLLFYGSVTHRLDCEVAFSYPRKSILHVSGSLEFLAWFEELLKC